MAPRFLRKTFLGPKAYLVFKSIYTGETKEKVKPCTSDWDLNLAKTHSLPAEITHLVSGLNEVQVLDVS